MPYISIFSLLVFCWLLAFLSTSVICHPSSFVRDDFPVSRIWALGYFFCATSLFACMQSAVGWQDTGEENEVRTGYSSAFVFVGSWLMAIVAGTRFRTRPVVLKYLSLAITACAVLWWTFRKPDLSVAGSLLFAGVIGLAVTMLVTDLQSRKAPLRDRK